MHFWLLVQPYIMLPSIVFMAITVLVFVMWLLGTDWYDNYASSEGKENLHFSKCLFWWCAVVTTLGFLFMEFLIYGIAAFNVFVLIVLGLELIDLIMNTFAKINKFCLEKRGKLK